LAIGLVYYIIMGTFCLSWLSGCGRALVPAGMSLEGWGKYALAAAVALPRLGFALKRLFDDPSLQAFSKLQDTSIQRSPAG